LSKTVDVLRVRNPTCKSRAGNKELWKRWAEEVKRVVVATRERLTRANLLGEYSKRIVLTMDGENGQLKQFEEQTTFASYLEELIVLSKLASATSLVAQSNDLSKMHSMIHKGCKTQADLDSDVTEYVRKQFDSVVVKQVFASRPSPTIVTQLGKIFSAFAFRAFEFLNPKVVRAGHIPLPRRVLLQVLRGFASTLVDRIECLLLRLLSLATTREGSSGLHHDAPKEILPR